MRVEEEEDAVKCSGLPGSGIAIYFTYCNLATITQGSTLCHLLRRLFYSVKVDVLVCDYVWPMIVVASHLWGTYHNLELPSRRRQAAHNPEHNIYHSKAGTSAAEPVRISV